LSWNSDGIRAAGGLSGCNEDGIRLLWCERF
jgi:hypothetical protein